MNVHKNARSCPASRALLVKRVHEQGWSVRAASEAVGMSDRRGREWIRRGERGEPLCDRSSRPNHTHSKRSAVEEQIVALRRQWLTMRQIAQLVGVGTSTVSRVCRSAGVNRLKQLDAPPPPIRYEREHPGELIHVDIKCLGRFDRPGHRITRYKSLGSEGMGFEFMHVATDDASRLSYAEIFPNQRVESAIAFVNNAVGWFAQHGVPIRQLMTDNGSAFVSYPFANACRRLKLHHLRTRPRRPQTNGKVDRFIQTLLREWAYRFSYPSSDERKRWLEPYLHFYNFHRAHSALSYNPPISRLDRNNLLKRNS